MTRPLRLIVFDVDGTLVDSQADIIAAMTRAFQGVNMAVPTRTDILSIVGLSLDVAMARLAPDLGPDQWSRMVEGYKDTYMSLRAQSGAAASSPLYPGAKQALTELSRTPENILGVATGKSKRGLDKLIEAHELQDFFVTRQVADFHPSKPHPSMLHTAMEEAGVSPEQTVMIGDTSYDMDMARAARVRAIGVSWGYHDTANLGAAHHIIDSFGALHDTLDHIWRTSV